jgi:hypothetical protein
VTDELTGIVDAPAAVRERRRRALVRLLSTPPARANTVLVAHLFNIQDAANISLAEGAAAVFRPLGGANLLVIGQNEEAARGLFTAACLSLAAQLPSRDLTPQPPSPRGKGEKSPSPHPASGRDPGGRSATDAGPDRGGVGEGSAAIFTVFDGTPDDSDDAEHFSKLATKLPGAAAPTRAGVAPALTELAAEMDRRHRGESADRTPRFLFVFGVHRFRDLRKAEEEFGFGRRGGGEREPSPGERFNALLRDGSPVGIHVVVWCDSLTNLNRTFDRPQLREFALRVLFQMSATDSSTLMDTPAAAKLGRTRALFLTEETERAEKFRPYGLPSPEWLDRACEKLRARVGLKAQPAGV